MIFAISAIFCAENVAAQPNPFGAIIGGAMQNNAKQEWAKLNENMIMCVNASIRKNRANVEGLINQGILPNDQRLGNVVSACDQLVNRQFRTNFECPLNINNKQYRLFADFSG